MLTQQLINGLTLGSIYALISLGYTMVYGILSLVNFAHSEIFMVGAFLSLCFLNASWLNGFPLWAQLSGLFLASMLGSALLGALIERVAYKPLRHASRLSALISAIGVSIFLQNFIFLFVSNQSVPFPAVISVKHFKIGGGEINSLQVFIIGVSILLMVGLQFFVQKTRLGKAMRATAGDRETAELLGINTNRIITLTFLVGGALGGAAGLLNGMYYGSIKYNMGFLPGIKAFTAAVLGGIGNIHGAMVGGLVIGILEALGAGFIPSGTEWKDIFAFAILILVLLFRPQGLFGIKTAEKV